MQSRVTSWTFIYDKCTSYLSISHRVCQMDDEPARSQGKTVQACYDKICPPTSLTGRVNKLPIADGNDREGKIQKKSLPCGRLVGVYILILEMSIPSKSTVKTFGTHVSVYFCLLFLPPPQEQAPPPPAIQSDSPHWDQLLEKEANRKNKQKNNKNSSSRNRWFQGFSILIFILK